MLIFGETSNFRVTAPESYGKYWPHFTVFTFATVRSPEITLVDYVDAELGQNPSSARLVIDDVMIGAWGSLFWGRTQTMFAQLV